MKVKASMGYTDFKLNKYLPKGTDLVEEYKKANIELDQERIDILLAGNETSNFKPIIEVEEEPKIETAIVNMENVETAVKPRRRVNKEKRSEDE